MLKKIIFVTFAFSCLSVFAQINLQPRLITYKLRNGLTVWINEDHSLPKVYGAVVVKAGGVDSPNSGIAHYFEHIMFKGTNQIGTSNYALEKVYLDSISAAYDQLAVAKEPIVRQRIQNEINRLNIVASKYAIPNEFNTLLTRFGGTNINAYTTADETVYHNVFSPQYINQWAILNSERFIHPVFRLFQGELETVYEEKNRASDNMFVEAFTHIQNELFKGSPYAYPVIGSTDSLKNPRLSSMRSFFNKYYVAENMGLMLCGDLHADSLYPLLEKTFGKIRQGEAPKRNSWQLTTLSDRPAIEVKMPIPIVKAIGRVYRGPLENDPDMPAMIVIRTLLTNENENGMLDSLANNHKVMASLAMNFGFRDVGSFIIGTIPKVPFGSKKKALAMVMQQVERLKKGDFSDKQLEMAKKDYERSLLLSLESMEDKFNMMIDLFSTGNTWQSMLDRIKVVKSLKRADVMRVAKRFFNDNYLTLVKRYGHYPKENLTQPGYKPISAGNLNEQSEFAKSLDKIPVKDVSVRELDFNRDAKMKQLAPLAKLYTTKNPLNALFTLNLTFHTGIFADSRTDALGNYLGQLGAGTMTKQQFGACLHELGATYNVSASNESFRISVTGFDEHLAPTIKLIAELLHHPRPDLKALKRQNSSMKAAESAFWKDNKEVLDAVSEYVKYGKKSTYLTRLSMKETERLTSDELLSLLKEVQTHELAVTYTGTVSTDSVAEIIQRNFDLAQITKQHRDWYRPFLSSSTPTVYIFDVPLARQNLIRTYMLLPSAPTWRDRDMQNLWGKYFGGSMSSVLFQDVRELRSMAYSTWGESFQPSFIKHPNEPTAYMATIGTQSDKTMGTLSLLDSLLNSMPERANSYMAAKTEFQNSLNQAYPTFRDMPKEIASYIMKGYEKDPTRDILGELDKIKFNDVMEYYYRNVQKKPYNIIIVGDLRKVNQAKLQQYGKVVILKKEDIVRQ